MKKKKNKAINKSKSRVKTAFATLLLVSFAAFTALFALNTDIVTEYFGRNPCVTGISGNPIQWNWNNKNSPNPAVNQSFEDYINETVFIGDSRTVGLYLHRYVKYENVFAKNGQNHQGARYERIVDLGTGKLLTVAEAVAITKPKRMIVSYGINGVGFFDKDTFFEQYSHLIHDLQAASPDSVIIIQSILPVSHLYQTNKDNRITNSKIDSYNIHLKELAEQKGCFFLDTSGLYKNAINCLSSEFDEGDGLHFNRHAYEVFLQHLDQNRIY